jgi:large subunit ribosomal protein L31
MKDGLHPDYQPVIFVDSATGKEFKTYSTAKSKTQREEDGITYNIITLEVTSDSHPFWTGKMHRLDTAGRIERFNKRFTNIATGVRKSRKVEKED